MSDEQPAGSRADLNWRFAGHALDENTLELKVGDAIVAIERKPLELLMYLLRHPGEVATKDEILEALWPGRIVSETALTNSVVKLRTALGDSEQQLIRTVHGYGYRLVAEVHCEAVQPHTLAPPAFDFKPGDAVPQRANWKFVEHLGGGGFGEVWLAAHAKTHEQRVFKFARDAGSLSALKREITLSRLLHDALGARDDLAHILDWNLDEAPYFIETEYSDQGHLGAWAEKQGGLAKIPLEQRLELIALAADALAAAHSVGVLHKDLKPANLLVYTDHGRARIRLADFGSARLLDSGRLQSLGITQLGFTQSLANATTSGTLMYLAPEVVAGQPPTLQSDIYALGVILYQVVMGDTSKTFAPGWEDDVEDALLREDIGLAAAGTPSRRLSDAAILARRLRTLDERRTQRQAQHQSEAVAAAMRKNLERAQARRGLLLALAATFLVGFAVSVVLYLDARRASRKAETISKFLTKDLLSSANPTTAGGADVKVREILSTAEATMASRFANDPDTLLALQTALGGAYAGLDIRDKSEALLQPALAAAVSRHGHDSRQAQSVREALLDLYVGQRDLEKIGKLAAEALAVERNTGNADSEFAIQTEQNQAALLCWTSGYAACQPVFQSLLERTDRILGPDHEQSARIAITYSSVLAGVGKKEQGMAVAEQGLQRLRNALGPDHPNVLTRSVHIGYLLQKSGRAAEAIKSLEALTPKIEKIYGADSTYARNARQMLALSYSKGGRAAEAIPIFEKLVESRKQQYGEADTESRLARRRRAEALHQVGRTAESIREIDALLVLHQQDKTKDPEEKAELKRLRDEFSTTKN